jgi:hypothetical protein
MPIATVAVPTPQTSPGPSQGKGLLAPAPKQCPTAPFAWFRERTTMGDGYWEESCMGIGTEPE